MVFGNGEEPTWLTMKEVKELTGIQPTTINRYKDDFPEFICHRMNGHALEFDERSIPVLQRIYMLYRDRSKGRRNAEKIKSILFAEYALEQPEIIDVPLAATTAPAGENTEVAPYNALLAYLQEQDQRLKTLESQNEVILSNQAELMDSQSKMQAIMNRHLELLSEESRSRMQAKKKGFLHRLFHREK